jgi:hypothetical protein
VPDFDIYRRKRGWHDWRATLQPQQIQLPHQKDLRLYVSDDQLDATNPWPRHVLPSWQVSRVGAGRCH